MTPSHRTESPLSGPQASRQLLFLFFSRALVGLLRWCVYPLASLLASKKHPAAEIRLLIGAGEKGWELIEYQEIFASASEYLGESNVQKLVFSHGEPLAKQLGSSLVTSVPSHYYFDARSGSQKPVRAVFEAISIGVMLERARVIPICALTDFPVRRWRLQTAIVSARRGIVTSLMSPSVMGDMYAHRRIVGPVPFPLSVATLRRLEALKRAGAKTHVSGKAAFVGMLYEPRKTTVEAIQKGLTLRGIPMVIIGRNPDGSRISDLDYWQYLSDARLIVSTSSQISGAHTDFDGHNHFIYKFIEATAAKTALAIEPVEGSTQMLTPDVDFLSYRTVDEAIEKIARVWTSTSALDKIAESGYKKTVRAIESHAFWRTVFA